MSNATTDKSTSRTTTDHIPCVRYGFSDDSDKARQAPRLKSIYESIPDDAKTASPIYLLTPDEYRRQCEIKNGWAIPGESCIANALQNDCEARDGVLYPVYMESDTFPKNDAGTLLEWFSEFLQGELELSPESCTYYFSGNRSIHVHVPRLISGEQDLTRFKKRAKAYCEENDADLDLGIYSRKRQFRLPGVVHQKTRLPKVQIEPEWDHDQIIAAATGPQRPMPDTFADVLEATFGPGPGLGESGVARRRRDESDLLERISGDESILSFASETPSSIATPLVEQRDPPKSESERRLWGPYNHKEFSPYAHAGTGNGRSMAAIRVLGGAFARKGVRSETTLVPAYFYGAHGCRGKEFTMYDTYAPLQVSEPDYAKWEFDQGDTVVVIGGKSGRSRLLEVDTTTAVVMGRLLHPEEGCRRDALTYLENRGFNTGSSGRASTEESKAARRRADFEQVLPVDDPSVSPAARLQWRAEQEGIQTLGHGEKQQVGFRLLTKYDWDPVWKWFQDQFGDDFKPGVTWRQLKSVVEAYSDQRTHVEVPPQP